MNAKAQVCSSSMEEITQKTVMLQAIKQTNKKVFINPRQQQTVSHHNRQLHAFHR